MGSLAQRQPTEDDARQILWTQGIVAPWYLRPSQLDIYELFGRTKRPHIECARQFGKTTSVLTWVLEQLNQNPGWICRWCEPWKEQCHEILIPAMNQLQAFAPSDRKMRWREKGSHYWHPNGSILYLRGVNEDKGESSRGPHANIIVADEFGSWRNARYIVDEVLKPQLETTDGWFVFTSTPPEDQGHLYYVYFDMAQDEGRAIQKTIYDNESLSPSRIEEIKKDCGGEESMAWLRERLLKRIKNPEKVVVPEYDEAANELPDDAPRPPHYDIYTGGDSGQDDNTAILFAYFDFEKDAVVFEDELVLCNATTKDIIAKAKAKELALWGTKECECALADYTVGPKHCFHHGPQPYRRVYDADKQLLFDITKDHKYPLEYPDKHDKIAAIRWFRRQVQERKVLVKKRCHALRRQLRVGQWANDKHLDFLRSDDLELKHLDALMAAIYTVRSVVRTHNPFPQYVGVSIYTNFLDPNSVQRGSQEQALEAALNPLGDGIG